MAEPLGPMGSSPIKERGARVDDCAMRQEAGPLCGESRQLMVFDLPQNCKGTVDGT